MRAVIRATRSHHPAVRLPGGSNGWVAVERARVAALPRGYGVDVAEGGLKGQPHGRREEIG